LTAEEKSATQKVDKNLLTAQGGTAEWITTTKLQKRKADLQLQENQQEELKSTEGKLSVLLRRIYKNS
jgi:hypothetical protein